MLLGSNRRAILGEHLLIMRWNDGSHVWHARVAESKGTPVKDLVSWGLVGEHLSTMSRNFPHGLVFTLPLPCHLSFLVFAPSRFLPCLPIEFHFVVVATFGKRLLVWAESFIKDLFSRRDALIIHFPLELYSWRYIYSP